MIISAAHMVIFISDMFGQSYVFGVEVSKATHPDAAEVHSIPELAKYYPVDPTPVNVPAKNQPAEY